MNGIDKIIEHIVAQSKAQCEEIVDSAQEECKRIREEYSKIEQEEYWKKVNAGAKEAENRLIRLIALAELESRKNVLATQQEMMDAAFKLAADKLIALPPHAQIPLLATLACEASITGEEEIIMSSEDKTRFGESLLQAANEALRQEGKNASLSLSEAAADIRGGFFLSGGDVIADCSIEAIVSMHRNDLTPFAAAELFTQN